MPAVRGSCCVVFPHPHQLHAAARQHPAPSPTTLPAAAGSWRRRLLPLPPSSSSPAPIFWHCWPRSSALCPGTIAAPAPCFAPWPRVPQSAALLPRPARAARLIFLMATSCRSWLKPNANRKVVCEQLCCYFRRLCPFQ